MCWNTFGRLIKVRFILIFHLIYFNQLQIGVSVLIDVLKTKVLPEYYQSKQKILLIFSNGIYDSISYFA